MSRGHGESDREAVLAAAKSSRAASIALANTTRAARDTAIVAIAGALRSRSAEVLQANAVDVERASASGTSDGLLDRLRLTPVRLNETAVALREIADLPDPVGEVVRGYTLPNGLQVSQLRVPIGVVAIIYEARPNVTVDAAGLGLKSANAVLLRGSSSAVCSNQALVELMQDAISGVGLPRHAVQLVPGATHESARHLMTARGLVDVVIPRGGAGLIRSVVDNSTVPVIETGVGNCHVYVDAAADIDKAVAVVVNSKTQRTSVCNAAETLLVHRNIAEQFLPKALKALADAGVTIHADEPMRAHCLDAEIAFEPAKDSDWADEYYSLDIAVSIVDSLAAAVDHIRSWSTGHTEAILTEDLGAARRFVADVDSAVVMVNASTRFTDGGQLGLGAEMGISTQKLHARGPMGLRELTTTKYVVTGDGHVRT